MYRDRFSVRFLIIPIAVGCFCLSTALAKKPDTTDGGGGGNGGGGLCCARHLHNRGFSVNLVLDRESSALHGAAADQLRIL